MNFCCGEDPVSTLRGCGVSAGPGRQGGMGEWVRVDGPNNETRHLAAMFGQRVSKPVARVQCGLPGCDCLCVCGRAAQTAGEAS